MASQKAKVHLHLWIKERHRRLDDRNGFREHGHGDKVLAVLNHRLDLQSQVHGLHDRGERVREGLARSWWQFGAILLGREVAEVFRWVRIAGNAGRSQQGSPGDQHVDRLGLIVRDGEEGARGSAIDHLDAEDLGVREGHVDIYRHGGRGVVRVTPLSRTSGLCPAFHVIKFDIGLVRGVLDIFNLCGLRVSCERLVSEHTNNKK